MTFLSRLLNRLTDRRPARPRSPQKDAFQPLLEALEDRTVPSTVSSIVSNFNGTAIPAGDTVWFSSVFKASGVGSEGTTIRVTDQHITFSTKDADYDVDVPDAVINLSPATKAADATTTFDGNQNTWNTNLPTSFSGNSFLSGVGFQVEVKLPGGINPVTWTAHFASDTAGITVNWQWGAAVYTQFNSDPSTLNVKPTDTKTTQYANSDHSGTPEGFKNFVIGGARGGGGSNFTGSYSATGKVKPEMEDVPPMTGSLSGFVYVGTDADGDHLPDTPHGYGGVTLTLLDANRNFVASTTTKDDGSYLFEGLAPGTYIIVETQPTDPSGTELDQGENSLGSLDGDHEYVHDEFTVTLTIGVNGIEYNYNELIPLIDG